MAKFRQVDVLMGRATGLTTASPLHGQMQPRQFVYPNAYPKGDLPNGGFAKRDGLATLREAARRRQGGCVTTQRFRAGALC